MAITGSFYNHTLDDFGSGDNLPGDTYKVVLLSGSYTPSAADTTYANVSAYEIDGGGWATGGHTLEYIVSETVAPDGFKFDAGNVSLALSGAGLTDVVYFTIVNTSNSNRLLFLYESSVPLSWEDGDTIQIRWPTAGIMTISPTP